MPDTQLTILNTILYHSHKNILTKLHTYCAPNTQLTKLYITLNHYYHAIFNNHTLLRAYCTLHYTLNHQLRTNIILYHSHHDNIFTTKIPPTARPILIHNHYIPPSLSPLCSPANLQSVARYRAALRV